MESLNSRSSQATAAICMSVVFICVGVPLWWKTTEVYRAELPYTEIQALSQSTPLTISAKVEVQATSDEMLKMCNDIFASQDFNKELKFTRTLFTFKINAAPLNNDETQVFENAKNTEAHAVFIFTHDVTMPKITATNNNVIKISVAEADAKEDVQKSVQIALDILRNDLMHLQYVDDAVGKALAVKLDFPKVREYHMRKTIQPDKGYDLLFTLICPKPGELQALWDIHNAMKTYLYPMLEKLGSYAKFHVESQILYYCDMPVKPQKFDDGHILRFSQLPHVVNPVESRLGAEMSANPTLNFVLYLTEDKYNPLYIERQDRNISSTNTILIPRWGAITMKNTNKTSAQKPRQLELKGEDFMGAFLAQFRSLLGLETNERENMVFEQSLTEGITDFELDYLMRSRAAENIASSIHTIHSLAKLLEKIQNIVIKDEIAQLCYLAVDQINLAKSALARGELKDALTFSNRAFEASETAFFDPTLLELLYFPEDQKFAIYIPLFLPISLPLISSLVNALKIWKEKKKQKLE